MATSKEQSEIPGASGGSRQFTLDNLERQWVKKSLQTQQAALVRARTKELDGSEIHALRSREIAALGDLINRFS